MSEFKELKAEYVRLAGKNPPPMSAEALRVKIDELKASALQSSGAGNDVGTAAPPQIATNENGEGSKSEQSPPEQPVVTQNTQPTPPAPAEQPDDLAAELEELGLVVDAEGNVGLVMLAGLSGPEICLAPNDGHTCPAREAISLVRAGFATAATE